MDGAWSLAMVPLYFFIDRNSEEAVGWKAHHAAECSRRMERFLVALADLAEGGSDCVFLPPQLRI
jgi:hypothetical protein